MKLPKFDRDNLDWLPTFYISHVAECFFRLPRLEKHLENVGMSNYKIVHAFNGWHDTMIHNPSPAATPGHYGCAMSKMEILEKYGGDNIVFFGEDDVRFVKDWQTKLLEALSVIPDDWELLQLGSFLYNSQIQVGKNLWTTPESNCLPATLMRGKRIQKLFCDFTRSDWRIGNDHYRACDWALARLCRDHNIEQYCTYPQLATQLLGYSLSDGRWENHHTGIQIF